VVYGFNVAVAAAAALLPDAAEIAKADSSDPSRAMSKPFGTSIPLRKKERARGRIISSVRYRFLHANFGLCRAGRLRLERRSEVRPSFELPRTRESRARVRGVEFGAFDFREKAAHVLAYGPRERGDHHALAVRTMAPGREQHALATMVGADDREVARDTRFVEFCLTDCAANRTRKSPIRHYASPYVDDDLPNDIRAV